MQTKQLHVPHLRVSRDAVNFVIRVTVSIPAVKKTSGRPGSSGVGMPTLPIPHACLNSYLTPTLITTFSSYSLLHAPLPCGIWRALLNHTGVIVSLFLFIRARLNVVKYFPAGSLPQYRSSWLMARFGNRGGG